MAPTFEPRDDERTLDEKAVPDLEGPLPEKAASDPQRERP